MTEVEKLYELAGVKPKECCDRDSDLCMSCCPEWNNRKSCWKYKSIAPPFTAEKQIELIKWLGLRRHLDIDIYNIKGCTIYEFSNDYDCITDEYRFMFDSSNFEYALAGLINNLWQDLTSVEKEQIREILK